MKVWRFEGLKLFDINAVEAMDMVAKVDSMAVEDVPVYEMNAGNGVRKVHDIMGSVNVGECKWWWSNGDWSLWEMVDYYLEQTGPGTEIYLATWSISELSARKLTDWMDRGRIGRLTGVIDYRSKNRHPAAFYLSKNIFSEIRVAYCHAKVTILKGNGNWICINGSANWTENPRLESGVVINSEVVASKNIDLINEVVRKGEYGLD